MNDVMFYEVFEEERRELEKFLPKGVQAGFTARTIKEEGGARPPAELISIRTQSRIPLEWSQGLKGILTRSQGYDHVQAFCREAKTDIPCGFLGEYCSRAVAEQAILMMMALLRKLKSQSNQFRCFSRDGLTGRECKKRKILIVGVGHIGREVVEIARGLEMEVRGVDIAPTRKDIEYVSLSDGVAWAEVIVCALPLTKETNGMLSYSALAGAGRGMVFINIARGEIAPIEGLKKLLDEKKVAGIGLDVYPREGQLADSLRANKLVEDGPGKVLLEWAADERILMTPHNAFNTKEAVEQKASLTIASVMSFLERKEFPYPVPVG